MYRKIKAYTTPYEKATLGNHDRTATNAIELLEDKIEKAHKAIEIGMKR